MNLNAGQRRAVEHPAGPLLVLAGPGTGKTRVLISRIAHLIEERDVEPSRILALTFSRRAAEEMEGRLREESAAAGEVEVRTFHSFALRLVRRHHTELGLGLPPEILPTARQWALMRELMKNEDPADWNLTPEAFERPATVREVYDLMLRARENSCGPAKLRRLGSEHGRPYLVRAGEVLEAYTRRLDRDSEVDYEQVVQRAIELLRRGSERLRDRYDHVLVDEFQDTNRSQLDLLKLLAPEERPNLLNLFCVGDDAQSIYGFRGARAENVGRFEDHFPGAKVVELKTNYRSAQPIVTLAGAALSVDEISRKRDQQELPGEKVGSVMRHIASSDRDEGDWISDRILELHARGVRFESVAILRRSLLDAKPLVEALRSRGVPVDFSNIPARTSAGRLKTLLEAADGEDPTPDEASRALVSSLAGVSTEGGHALRATAAMTSQSVFEMIRAEYFPASLSPEDGSRAAATVSAVDEARKTPDFLEKLDLLWKTLPGTGELFARHREDPRAARALSDASAFLRAARAYYEASREPTVAGFVSAGTMVHEDSDTWAPTSPSVEGAVRIMTVHASKGLEFEAVFVSGLSDERFPVRSRGVRFVDTGLLAGAGPTLAGDLEISHTREERRLFYVALTRAETYLYLTGVEESSNDGAKVSPFLSELEGRLARLESKERARRFWVSRGEAVEELRRVACDEGQPREERFAAARALAEMDERPDDELSPWWRYVAETAGEGPPPDERDLREREVVAVIECPRRAFLRRLNRAVGGRFTEGAPRGGKGAFGRIFLDGFREFLSGEHGTLEEAVGEQVERGDADGEFGGPAFTEHWRREVARVCPGCEAWAEEARADLVETGGEWSMKFGERNVSGKHGPIIEREGKLIHLKVSTGGTQSQKTVEADPTFALRTLGAGADAAEARFVQEVQKKSRQPAKRTLGDSENWREDFGERVKASMQGFLLGEYPPQPTDEALCSRCEFRSICPAHREDEPWT